MRLATGILAASGLGLVGLATAAEIYAYQDTVDERDMQSAVMCLHVNFCRDNEIPTGANIRCKVNDAVAYVCNYNRSRHVLDVFRKMQVPCSLQEMVEARMEIAGRHKGAQTGWWFEPDWEKAMGFEKWCRKFHDKCGDNCGNNPSGVFVLDFECISGECNPRK